MESKYDTRCLNSLKFFAACIVAFVWHYQHFSPANGSPFDFIFKWSYPFGWLMVELFFMLSGMGMFWGYYECIHCHKMEFSEYIYKRLIKIYPLFILTLGLVIIFEFWHKIQIGDTFVYSNFDLWHLLLNIFLCQDGILCIDWSFNAPSWCISVCFLLYIIFYLVVYFSRNRRMVTCFFCCLGILGAYIITAEWNYPVLLNSLVGRGILCFSIGVMIANIYQSINSKEAKILGCFSLLCLVILYVMYIIWGDISGNMHLFFIFIVSPLIINTFVFVPCVNKFFSLRPFVYLGSLSMEIYLFHFIVQCAIRDVDIFLSLGIDYSRCRIWIMYVVITLVISIIYKQFFINICTKTFGIVYKKIINIKISS
ncbi:MAG: acyltransferase [Lachnospiraceae bacterium]|nr:acyltransferase [Lachnospiraceae bacterium]